MTEAASVLLKWKRDPVAFVREVFGVEPDYWQAETLQAFASDDPEFKRISMQACAGPGKSTILAWCGWNFLLCYAEPGQHPKAAAVSITADNLKDNLWSELSKWQQRSKLLMHQFTWTHTRIFNNDYPSTWFLSARSFPKSASADEIGSTLSGLHSEFVLYLIDESGSIPPSIIKSAEQGLSTGPKFGKILQAGNPTSHDGMLYAASKTYRDQWHVIRITGDPDDVKRSPRIDIEWARGQIKLHGRDNPWVMAYILGQFPESSINSLLSIDQIDAAMERTMPEHAYSWAQKRLGVDVARFGVDRNVIFPRQGLRAYRPVITHGQRSNETAARIMQAKNKWGSQLELVDGTGGFGSGVVDSLMQAGAAPLEIHFSGKPIDTAYLNKRAEMWFLMAEWIKRGGWLPKMPELAKELAAPQYMFVNGKFQLESKDQIKQRLGFSPDLADALCLTFAMPETAGADSPEMLMGRENKKVKVDYDPFGEFNKAE